MTNLTYTGSSVSGIGYGYEIYRDAHASSYVARLRLDTRCMFVTVDTFAHAHEVGRAFCHACRQWDVVQNRERALAQGFAVLG